MSAAPKFTPGPWFVKYDDAGGYDCMTSGYHVGPKNGTNWLETVVTVDTGTKGETETSSANARLIAAAPDFYAVLDVIANAGTVGGVSAGERKGIARVAVIARAALAKVSA